MIAAREGPNVAVEMRKKLDDDGIFGLRDEIALGEMVGRVEKEES